MVQCFGGIFAGGAYLPYSAYMLFYDKIATTSLAVTPTMSSSVTPATSSTVTLTSSSVTPTTSLPAMDELNRSNFANCYSKFMTQQWTNPTVRDGM